MKKLDRYLTINVVKIFLITECAGLALALVIEFFERMDHFTSSFKSFSYSLVYLSLKIPGNFNLILPLAFLIAMLIVFIMMIRANEMIVVRTSGISTFSLMRPMLGISIVFVALSFLISETVIPKTAYAAEYIYMVKIRKEESYVHFKNDKIWFKKDNVINNIDFFDTRGDKNVINGLTVIELSPTFSITRRIDAEKGEWVNGTWYFTNVVERTFNKGNMVSKKKYESMNNIITESPTVFKVAQKNPEDMGYRELSEYIKKMRRKGHDVRRYLVDLYNKLAFPFNSLIMVLVAFTVGLRYSKTQNISKGVLMGLSVGALYWAVHSVSLSFGYSEIFPPIFAAWLTNIIFLAAGVIGIVSLRT